MRKDCFHYFAIAFLTGSLAACTYNPLSQNNHLTGSAVGAAVGGAIGAGAAAILQAPKSVVLLAGLGGAGVGYYTTTLRFDSAGILQAGGQVYTLGDYVGINIPTDNLFDSNSTDFLPGYEATLDSVVAVLSRYPENNIVVSGNMSGFAPEHFEVNLSEERARRVATYLWAHGINAFQGASINTRKLVYTGYGNYFPIANHIHAKSIRENSRIQITSYPTKAHLHLDQCHDVFTNIGGFDGPSLKGERPTSSADTPYRGDLLPEAPAAPVENDYKGATGDGWHNYNSVSSTDQTPSGVKSARQGGYSGNFKGE